MVDILFSAQQEGVVEFFYKHGLNIPENIMQSILRFLSRACFYEEEEKKICPQMLIGNNIENEDFKKMFQVELIHLISDSSDNTNVDKRIKSLVPFCNNGWRVYLDINEGQVNYGIVRTFAGVAGHSVREALQGQDKQIAQDMREYYDINFSLIDVSSTYEIMITAADGEQARLDFRIHNDLTADNNSTRANFLNDYLKKAPIKDEKVERSIKKVINLFNQKVHGTICLIVDSEHIIPDNNLKDGIFLKEPINLVELAIDALGLKQDNLDANYNNSAQERFYALSGLFIEMLNVDGITIIDNTGCIRAYNVFVKSTLDKGQNVGGGARKRAAMSLVDSKCEGYIGVYFQSQDGNSFYKGVNK